MNRRGDARCITRRPAGIGARELVVLENDYFRRCLDREEGPGGCREMPGYQGWRLQGGAKNLSPKRRNIREAPFVYTGAVRYAAALGEIQKKPRGGSRGAMTRSLSGR